VGTRTVKFALKAKREAQDNLLDKDVVEIVEGMVEELRTSIGDFEKMTMAAMEANNLPVAVGAKKGANEAREKLRELLQSVGALPHDLGTLTHVIDLRAVVVEINTAVEEFMTWMKSWVEAVEQEVELPAEKKVEVLDAAGRVVQRLDQIAGAPQNVGNEDPDQPGGDHHG
jgi:enamine deaminase RidA (YjgF/YER057c/UK114 family)